MNVGQWKQNKLLTPQGKEYVQVSTSANGEINVAKDVFVVDGTQPNFCMVSIVNDSTTETVPTANFSTYNDFVNWVHRERCVAVRNFSLQFSGTRNDYEILYHIENPETSGRLGSVLVMASNLPAGTVFGLVDDSVGINKIQTFDPNDPSKHQVTDSGYLISKYDGYVKVFARLPVGGTWPVNAKLETSFWIIAEEHESMLRFALPVPKVMLDTRAFSRMNASGRLVRVGSCTTMYL